MTTSPPPLPEVSQTYKPRFRLDKLIPHPRNPRRHDDDQISDSLDQHGFYGAVLVQQSTGMLIAGHGRARNATEKGATTVPAILIDVDDDEALRILLHDNRTGDGASYDHDRLARILTDLDDDLVGTGYDDDDVAALVAAIDPPTFVDTPDTPDPKPAAKKAISKRGDVWMIGPHRLMVGDCRDIDDVALVLDGSKINIAVTSPPYAEQREYDTESGFTPIPPDGYVEWFDLVQSNVAAHIADDGSWFVNIKPASDGDDRSLYVLDLVAAHVRRWGWHFAEEFCWERVGVPVSPYRRFKNQFEPVFQFARNRWKFRPDNVRHASASSIPPQGEGAGNTNGGGSESNAAQQGNPDATWFQGRAEQGLAYPGNRLPTFSGSHQAVGHPAAFPTGLPGFFIQAYTDEDDTVFDPFVGSGSSIIAAHHHNRIGYGMEISPSYADIAMSRIEGSTGLTPHRAR